MSGSTKPMFTVNVLSYFTLFFLSFFRYRHLYFVLLYAYSASLRPVPNYRISYFALCNPVSLCYKK